MRVGDLLFAINSSLVSSGWWGACVSDVTRHNENFMSKRRGWRFSQLCLLLGACVSEVTSQCADSLQKIKKKALLSFDCLGGECQ